MAKYKTQTVFNILLALPACLVGIYYLWHPSYALFLTFVITFAYCTFFMNPNLDSAHKIKLFSIRGLLTLPFRFYSIVFGHRSISHSLIFGPLTRLIWLGGIAFLLFWVIYKTLPTTGDFKAYYNHYRLFIWYGVAGICIADLSHLLLDVKIRK